MRIKLSSVKIAVTIYILLGIVFLSAGCLGQSNAAKPGATQTTTVQRGSISIAVTGTGNLALKNKQSLSFGQTGLVTSVVTAKVSEVDVSEGQSVEQGQVLAKADTTDWQNRVTALKHQLDSAKANLIQAQVNVITAQSNLASAQANQATAQYNFSQQKDIKAIQDKIDNANVQLQYINAEYQIALKSSGSPNSGYLELIANYNKEIAQYQKDMQTLLDDPAHSGAASSVADIITLQIKVQQAQTGVEQAQKSIELAQANVIIAQNAVDDAQTSLNSEQDSLQVIKAPFKGLITKVNVNQGDIVQRNANLIEIADPNKFEANVLVTERDVTSVVIGSDATVSFDALPDLTFPAKITLIAPLATVQQGVVNYKVTVELTSTKPVAAAGSSAAGTPLINLKDGFAAVVNIPVQKKDNILIVPSRAISHQGQNYVVQVQIGTTLETRIVKIGITDFQNTEITEGLNEGDKVVLLAIPTASPTPGGIFGGGGG